MSFRQLISLFALAGVAWGCVSKSDMYGAEEGTLSGVTQVSVRYLKTLYTGYATPVNEEVEIAGYVTANDRYGTFPNTIYVEDETGGIAVKLSGSDLFLAFPIGLPVRVQCRGLVLGGYGGEVSLGAGTSQPEYQNGFIPSDQASLYLRPGAGIVTLYPAAAQVEELIPLLVGNYVSLENVQFVEEELGLSWCDPDTDTDRHLVTPAGNRLVVRTSRHAQFAAQILPERSGHIEGILGYFNGNYQLRVITHTRAIMEEPRFTPASRSE